MPNRLAASSSPYLRQHQENPVDWYEWSDEALDEATRSDLPILLSVGYATCHWCHVMAHESFEDEATAAYMNEHFVNIKVDREERPDIDRIYMDAVQAMTGRGGWPMTVFLTPDGEPFFAGTYFPKEDRGHHPSFMRVLESITAAWHNDREQLNEQAARLTAAVRAGIPAGERIPTEADIDRAAADLVGKVDWAHGGFGGAPKFPQAPNLEFALRLVVLRPDQPYAEEMRKLLAVTLDHMAAGGIYDHLGGGFSRYSVDREWLVPHFEKMLYDNALLARIYLRAAQVFDEPRYRHVATATLDYILTDLADDAGGFYSGEDADSEGEEGKFYVWTWDELRSVLGSDLELVAAVFGASPQGNFEGANVLHRPEPIASVAARLGVGVDDAIELTDAAVTKLRAVRAERVRPATDDKIVTAWNGLALRAFAEAAAVLGNSRYLTAATSLAEFMADRLFTPTGRLVRTWRRGVMGPPGFCDDYAAVAVGLLTLYQVGGDTRWFDLGERLVRDAVDRFATGEDGFHATGEDAPALIARPVNLMDNPTPSDNSLMAEALQLLAALTGDGAMIDHLHGIYRAAAALTERYPSAVGHLLAVATVGLDGPKEVAIVGEPAARTALELVVWEAFRPDCVVATAADATDAVPLLAGRTAEPGESKAYVCRNFVCDLPVGSAEELRTRLD